MDGAVYWQYYAIYQHRYPVVTDMEAIAVNDHWCLVTELTNGNDIFSLGWLQLTGRKAAK